jgi:nucleoside-diphosphate-sugar epimerase
VEVAIIVGATGTLGAAVESKLRSIKKYRVITASRKSVDIIGHTARLDFADVAKTEEMLRQYRPSVIVNSAVSFSSDFDESYEINVKASRNLLELIKALGLNCRCVLIGSAAEYGAINPQLNPISESQALAPISIYGLTKAWQSQLAPLYAGHGVHVMIARVFNLDGPKNAEHLFLGRVDRQIEEFLAGKRSAIEVGSTSAIRDYISVEQAAEQVVAIAEMGESGNVYHVASGNPATIQDVLRRRLRRADISYSVVKTAPGFSNRAGHDVQAIYADTTKTRALLKRWRAHEA